MSRGTATRSEANVPAKVTQVKEEAAEEPTPCHQIRPVAASRGQEVLPVLMLGLEEEEEEQDEEPVVGVSDQIRTLQAVSSRKAELVAKLSALDQRKLKLAQEQEQIEREEAQILQEMRTLTSQEMRSLAPSQADAPQAAVRGPKRRADSITFEQATPKRAKLRAGKATITFKQLRDYVDDLKQQGGKPSGQLQCPVCVLKQRGFAHFVRHLYEHLPTKAFQETS